jgi:hypothetical protein
VALLLDDKRVDIEHLDYFGNSAFFVACHSKFTKIVQHFMESPCLLDPQVKPQESFGPEVLGVFEKYKPVFKARHAAWLYSRYLLIQDGLYTTTTPNDVLSRFFGILRKLPTELTMLTCNLAMGSTKSFVHTEVLKGILKWHH